MWQSIQSFHAGIFGEQEKKWWLLITVIDLNFKRKNQYLRLLSVDSLMPIIMNGETNVTEDPSDTHIFLFSMHLRESEIYCIARWTTKKSHAWMRMQRIQSKFFVHFHLCAQPNNGTTNRSAASMEQITAQCIHAISDFYFDFLEVTAGYLVNYYSI